MCNFGAARLMWVSSLFSTSRRRRDSPEWSWWVCRRRCPCAWIWSAALRAGGPSPSARGPTCQTARIRAFRRDLRGVPRLVWRERSRPRIKTGQNLLQALGPVYGRLTGGRRLEEDGILHHHQGLVLRAATQWEEGKREVVKWGGSWSDVLKSMEETC